MMTRCGFALLLLLAGIPLAYSKGSPALILISGGGLAQPIEVTDPSLLKAFDPWMGQFADWRGKPLVDAPCFRRSFEVLFYMQWPGRESALDRGDLQMIYYATRTAPRVGLDTFTSLVRASRSIGGTLAPSSMATRRGSGTPRLRHGIP
jgi:hypothetical protein